MRKPADSVEEGVDLGEEVAAGLGAGVVGVSEAGEEADLCFKLERQRCICARCRTFPADLYSPCSAQVPVELS